MMREAQYKTVDLREQERMENLYGLGLDRLSAADKARSTARSGMISGLGQAAASYGTYLSTNPNISTVDGGSNIPTNLYGLQQPRGEITGGTGTTPGGTQYSVQSPYGVDYNPYNMYQGGGGYYGGGGGVDLSLQSNYPSTNYTGNPLYGQGQIQDWMTRGGDYSGQRQYNPYTQRWE